MASSMEKVSIRTKRVLLKMEFGKMELEQNGKVSQ